MEKETYQTTLIGRLKAFHSYSGYIALLVIFTGLVAAIALIPHKSHSTGVDPAVPVDDNIVNNINKAINDGADSYKALISDHTTPEQIAAMLRAADGHISITTRPIGISAQEYTDKLNAGISMSGVSIDKSSLYISCCANEPEVDEPKDPVTEANDMKYFLQHFAYTNNASIGSYVINANGTFWMDYYVDYMEALGPNALAQIDYTPINDYGHVGGQLDAVVDFLSLFYSNPQVYIYETGPMYPDRAPQTYEEFVTQLMACQASPNCIGTMLFNPYWQNGQFVTTNWHSFTQADIVSILGNPDLQKQYGVYIKQLINVLARDWLKFKNGLCGSDPTCIKNAASFEALLEAALARVSQSYAELGNENLYGVSSYVDAISCGNGSLTYSYNVVRNDGSTTVADVSIGISYRLLAPDGSVVGGGSLGGSPMYGGNMNRPGGDKASTGKIITLNPGDQDNINHTLNFPPGFNGTLEINTDLGFKSQYGQNHIVNSCKMVITNGACGTFVCTGGSIQDMYCRANNDQVRPAPRKPDVVAPDWESVNSCSDGNKNKLTLSYTARGVPAGEVRQYRLGFQITGIQLLRELADQGKDILNEPIGRDDYTPDQIPDNPPVSIQRRLSIDTINSSSNQGYMKAKLKNFSLKLNETNYDKFNFKNQSLHPNTDVDAGVDLLEFVFERMCYLSSIQSTNPDSDTFCDKIFSDLNKLDLGSYDDLSSYKYFPELKTEILSCNGGGVAQYNKQPYQNVGGAEYPVNPDGSGSYILSRWEMEPYRLLPPFPMPGVQQKGDIKINTSMNVSLIPTRVSWMVSSLLANEAGFLAHSFETKEQFDKYYDMCLRDPVSQTGGAAKITFMLVLEEGKPLECPPDKIPLDKYEWKRVKTAKGEAYIPGLGTLYRFLSNVQNSAGNANGELPNQAPGISLRFNPDSENPCNNLIFLPPKPPEGTGE